MEVAPRPDFIDALGKFWRLSEVQQKKLLGKRRKLRESRFKTLIDIRIKLGNFFRDEEIENAWLRTSVPELKSSPLKLIESGDPEKIKLLQRYLNFLCYPNPRKNTFKA